MNQIMPTEARRTLPTKLLIDPGSVAAMGSFIDRTWLRLDETTRKRPDGEGPGEASESATTAIDRAWRRVEEATEPRPDGGVRERSSESATVA